MKLIFRATICSALFMTGPAFGQTPPPVPVQQVAPAPAAAARPGLNIVLKDGKTATASAIRRAGDNVMATVQLGASAGEIGYPVANIAKIDFPEPPQIKAATDMLEVGENAGALALINPIVDYYNQFKDLPGSWWLQTARVKLKALVALQRDQESEVLVNEIVKASTDPESIGIAKVLLAASWARKGDHEKAIAAYDDVIKTGTDDETLARAWVNKGRSLLALKEFDPALLAFLHVPVFYPEQQSLIPQSLLGSGMAYVGIEDLPDAEKSFTSLIEKFPRSPESAVAKTELEKIKKSSRKS